MEEEKLPLEFQCLRSPHQLGDYVGLSSYSLSGEKIELSPQEKEFGES